MAKVSVVLASGRRREYELQKFNSVGRHPMQMIQVLDPQVSKEHLVIEQLDDGHWVVRDLESLNGTTLNDEQLTERKRLADRDRIRVGSSEILFSDPHGVAAGDHRVTIADNIESSIYGSIDVHREFLPVEVLTDDKVLRRDYEKLRLATLLNNEISQEVRLDKLLPLILGHLLDLFKADRGVVLLAESPGGEMVARVVKMREGQAGPKSIALSETIIQKVCSERTGVLTSDAQRDNRFSGAQSVILHGIRSTMCVPLTSRAGDVMGVIHLDSTLRINAFEERDLAMLQGVAHQAAIAIENSRMFERIQHDAVTREKFAKMLSPNLVERVISGDLRIQRGGEQRNVTVMFTDIRDFTALSELTPPPELVKMLNEYFEIVVDVVFEHHGTLDKYIGDSVMAVWGAPAEDPKGLERAVRAAVGIQRAMGTFNELRQMDGLATVHTGIGIATGEIVAGYMGSSKTMNYTVVGPSVNLASRLCDAASGDEILVSGNAYEAVAELVEAEKREPLKLKGIRDLVSSYSVLGLKGGPRHTSASTTRVRKVTRTSPAGK